jgi:hypothetical protein
VLPLAGRGTKFGFRLEDWKPWTAFDGTPTLVPGGFNTEPEANGDLLQYPQGDRSESPSGVMPAGGYYFDSIPRQDPIDEARLDPQDNLEEFGPVSDADVADFAARAEQLWTGTDYAILAAFGGTAFGDISHVPAPQLRHPRGIRDVAEWYMSTATRRDYIYKVFEGQCAIGLANLAKFHQAVGERVTAVYLTGSDFGTQQGPLISRQTYRDLFLPFHRAVTSWVREHTTWKTFMHTCGSVSALIPDFLEAGFEILNPVQVSAAHMDPAELKARFGDRLTFWGGGVNTQRTLPFGTPEEVKAEVREHLRAFAPGGGYVFNAVHNLQAGVPIENVLAFYEAFREAQGR